ncbi:MAG: response regulator [Xanthomonadales bacterium]|nr:response regulator [Xanthomonadales bacterium]
MSLPPLRTLLVDDEALARRGLRLRLAAAADVEIIGEAGDGVSALALIDAQRPDLVFLDVQMPGLDGFGVLAALAERALESLPQVVFVTAYDHYALRAFETRALDYLLKPVEPERLQRALERVREQRRHAEEAAHCAHLLGLLGELAGRPSLTLDEALRAERAEELKRSDRLAIRDSGRTVLVPLASIRWIDAAGDYMCIHTDSGTHVLRATLMVHATRVVEVRPHWNGEAFLKLDCGQELKLSRGYRERFRA